jgi:hypothetical protein
MKKKERIGKRGRLCETGNDRIWKWEIQDEGSKSGRLFEGRRGTRDGYRINTAKDGGRWRLLLARGGR